MSAMLPLEVVLIHVLPKCDIDTRLAFGIMPNRIDVSGYERGALGKALRYRIRPVQYGNGDKKSRAIARVPLWHVGGESCQGNARTFLRIAYVFKRYAFNDPMYSGDRFRDCMMIKVTKHDHRFSPPDKRCVQRIASFAIDSFGKKV